MKRIIRSWWMFVVLLVLLAFCGAVHGAEYVTEKGDTIEKLSLLLGELPQHLWTLNPQLAEFGLRDELPAAMKVTYRSFDDFQDAWTFFEEGGYTARWSGNWILVRRGVNFSEPLEPAEVLFYAAEHRKANKDSVKLRVRHIAGLWSQRVEASKKEPKK